LLFFVLFLGVVRNPNVPYFLRFNALQALLTDIVVIVLSFAFSILLRTHWRRHFACGNPLQHSCHCSPGHLGVRDRRMPSGA
jgi:hypothetical protein